MRYGPSCSGPPSRRIRFGDPAPLLKWILAALVIVATVSGAWAAGGPTTRFWNLTGETITHLSLAPSGTAAWGPDQCRNDPDGSVDFDERLRITGVPSGRYDVRFEDKAGRRCIVKGIDIKAGAVFSIDKDALTGCAGQ